MYRFCFRIFINRQQKRFLLSGCAGGNFAFLVTNLLLSAYKTPQIWSESKKISDC